MEIAYYLEGLVENDESVPERRILLLHGGPEGFSSRDPSEILEFECELES